MVPVELLAGGRFAAVRRFSSGKSVEVEVWRPRYKHGTSEKPKYAEIGKVRAYECPVGLLDGGDALGMIARLLNAQAVAGKSSASLYGANISRWPLEWYQAALIVASEDSEIESAIERQRDA